MRKTGLLILIFIFFGIDLFAQKDLVMSQYMHNRYTINPAFAGNRETTSLFGTFRKKWAGVNKSPNGQYFSGHAPLKKEKIAVGIEIYNQQIAVTGQTGFSFSYTYRLPLANNKKLAFSLSGGAAFRYANWSDVFLLDELKHDEAFASNESKIAPIIGFGAAWYSNSYFAGFSIPSFFHYDAYVDETSSFSLDKANYLFTGGYLFNLSNKFGVQPTFLARLNPSETTIVDINATIIYDNMIWLGASYRTTKEYVALVGYQITPQLRFSYSFDYTTGDLATYNNGTHEIALQFDFGFKVNSPNPKFF